MTNDGGLGSRPDSLAKSAGNADEFDFSTPEGVAAIRAANELVLEVARPLARKVALYERTLGLAVVPVLIRRWMVARLRRRRHPGPGAR